jgi:hypothetical protein
MPDFYLSILLADKKLRSDQVLQNKKPICLLRFYYLITKDSMKALLAKKVGMTQIFDANGVRSGVTVLEVGPCVVTALKSVETDGYSAVQIGYGEAKKLSKTQAGQLKKSGAKSTVLREVRNDEIIEDIE